MTQIILASQSPRRRELLQAMGVAYTAVPSAFEEHLDDNRSPHDVACELALGKAKDVARQHPDAIVIGSDTIVTLAGRQLEKPADSDHAHAMLKMLSGASNEVTTGVAIVCEAKGIEMVDADTTTVHFKPYNEAAIRAYVATGDPLDKAGAFGIQNGAAALISHIEGYFDTVVGLPTHLLASMLAQVGVEAHPAHVQSPVEQR